MMRISLSFLLALPRYQPEQSTCSNKCSFFCRFQLRDHTVDELNEPEKNVISSNIVIRRRKFIQISWIRALRTHIRCNQHTGMSVVKVPGAVMDVRTWGVHVIRFSFRWRQMEVSYPLTIWSRAISKTSTSNKMFERNKNNTENDRHEEGTVICNWLTFHHSNQTLHTCVFGIMEWVIRMWTTMNHCLSKTCFISCIKWSFSYISLRCTAFWFNTTNQKRRWILRKLRYKKDGRFRRWVYFFFLHWLLSALNPILVTTMEDKKEQLFLFTAVRAFIRM